MGRIKTLLIKRVTRKLISLYKDQLSEDFSSNKPIVSKYTNIESTKTRNIIAGYAARLMKQENATGSSTAKRRNTEDLSKFY